MFSNFGHSTVFSLSADWPLFRNNVIVGVKEHCWRLVSFATSLKVAGSIPDEVNEFFFQFT
jgi:hypothetical protein